MDEELQPPRKRQRRFENVRFSVEQIKRSKVVVMNEFLKTLVTPNISRHAAKKLESSHQEKQYMLDLACEEVRKIIDTFKHLASAAVRDTLLCCFLHVVNQQMDIMPFLIAG